MTQTKVSKVATFMLATSILSTIVVSTNASAAEQRENDERPTTSQEFIDGGEILEKPVININGFTFGLPKTRLPDGRVCISYLKEMHQVPNKADIDVTIGQYCDEADTIQNFPGDGIGHAEVIPKHLEAVYFEHQGKFLVQKLKISKDKIDF